MAAAEADKTAGTGHEWHRVAAPGAVIGAVTPGGQAGQMLGMEEFDRLLVELHILSIGDGRSLSTRHQMAPAPRLARCVELFHNGLMVFERMHLGEVIVAGD